jgi:preprotein translocase subunit SecD
MMWKQAKEGGLWEKAMAGMQFGLSSGGSLVEMKVNEAAESAIPRLKAAIAKETKQRDAIAEQMKDEEDAHKHDLETLKDLDTARKTLQQQTLNQAYLEQAYNERRGILLQHEQRAKDAPFTPGLGELASYRGPYGFLAREVLAGRDRAKQESGFADPEEMAALRSEYGTISRDFGTDYRSATTHAARRKAFQRYSERVQGLLTGHVSPEMQLEQIHLELKQLNDQARKEGLVVRGPD